MKIITLEEHYSDRRLMDEIQKFQQPRPEMTPEQAEAMTFLMSRSFPGPELLDFEERIAYMDRNRIDVQVLSVNAAASDQMPLEEAVRISRMANDITKEYMDQYPGRFEGFATLPMGDPEAAAAELERCVKELGFCGAMIAGTYKGRFYDEPEFFPVFEKAADLNVPVYFHPALVPMNVQETYYMSDSYSLIVGSELSSAGYGWHSQVGIQVARLILSGIFDKLPDLKIISGHWGETIPAFLERMDTILDQEITGLKKTVSAYYKEHVYITPSGIMSADQLEYLVKVMGADHVMYAIDYPYMKPENAYEFLMDSSLSDEEKELIAHQNAENLLHLK